MPLLHGKPFTRQKTLLMEEGFKCKATHEVFRTYDECVEKTILCNSEVWSCSLTNKPGLTYQEAVDSERRARENLQNFPSALVRPLLHLASLSRQSHLSGLCEDVYNFAKKRYFPGEIVDVTGHNGAKWLCEILEVQSTSLCCNSLTSLTTVANGNGKQPPDGDAIVISNRKESTPSLHINRKNMKFLSPVLFRYIVKLVRADDSSPFVTEGKRIKRKKNLRLSKEILKLLLKQHCEKHGGIMILKPSTVSKFGLSDQSFSQLFPDEPLHFPCSSQAKGWRPAAPVKKDNTMSSAKKDLRVKMMSFANNKHKVKREKVGVQEARMGEKDKGKEECQRKGLKRRFEEEKPRKNEGIKRMKLEMEQEKMMEKIPSVSKFGLSDLGLSSAGPAKKDNTMSSAKKRGSTMSSAKKRDDTMSSAKKREWMELKVKMMPFANKNHKVKAEKVDVLEARMSEEDKGKELFKLKELKEKSWVSLANKKLREEEQERLHLEKKVQLNKLKEQRLVSLAKIPSNLEKQRKKEQKERLKDKGKEVCPREELKRRFEEEKPWKNEGMKRMKLEETKQGQLMEMVSSANKKRNVLKEEREQLKEKIKSLANEKQRKKEEQERIKLEKEIQQNKLKEERLVSLANEKQRKKEEQERIKLEKEIQLNKLKQERLVSLANEKQRKKEEQERIKLDKEIQQNKLKEERLVYLANEKQRKKKEQERIKLDKEIQQNKLKEERLVYLANEKQRKKEEHERLKLEKEMERKKLKEDEKARKKEEQELMKLEKEMERKKLKENMMSQHKHVRTEKEDVQEALRRQKEELRKRLEEEKQRKKEEKEMEREKLREEKKRHAEQIKLWSKPREDMECDDLKELPCPVPVHTRVPAELFGDVLMVLEFLCTFEEFFFLKDEFPDGVTLDVLEEALVGSNPEGPLCELLKFFLSAIFHAQTEELEAGQTTELREAHKTKPTHSTISTVASLAAAWSQVHQGCNIKKLELNSCTVSEILRLHILSSGADCDHGNAMFRYLKQGGFASTDDPCVELQTANLALLERLAHTVVYDLTPGEKLIILQALCGKLLTLVKTRDVIEENTDKHRIAKQELRQIRAEQHRRDREAAQKLREQAELRKKEVKEKLKDGNGNEHPESLSEHSTEDEDHHSNHNEDGSDQETHLAVSSTSAPISLTAEKLEEEQRKVKELQDRIQKASRCMSLIPLGRDRFYRRYWLVPSACALFVEDDYFGLTEDMLEPHPASTAQDGQTEDEGQQDTHVDTHSPTSIPAGVLPVTRTNRWAFYNSVEEVKQLTEALNPRGHRESRLKEALHCEKDRITQTLSNTAADRYNCTAKVPESLAPAESFIESRLRDMLLGIEGRIYEGNLGALKIAERDMETWRSALERGRCKLPAADGRKNGETNRGEEMEVDDSQPESSAVRCLRHALFQIEQGIERRFLQAPLGGESKSKNNKKSGHNRKKNNSDSDNGSSVSGQMVLERWRESLQSCSSLSQVFVHLSTLDRSITWAKSLLNTRCKLCRRKGDSGTMLLCDGCDRGHHLQCLRPRLKSVPDGEWFCPDCRPKQRAVHRVFSRKRTFEESEKASEDEEPKRRRKRSVAVKLPPSSRSAKQRPKGHKVWSRNGSSARKSSSASRSLGKRAMLPYASSKRTPVSKGKPGTRAGQVRTASTPASTPRDPRKGAATGGSLSRKPSAKRSRI